MIDQWSWGYAQAAQPAFLSLIVHVQIAGASQPDSAKSNRLSAHFLPYLPESDLL
jgi:hypothetical protein